MRRRRNGLRALRLRRGFGQRELALRAGISCSHLCRVESGERPVTPAVVAALAVAIGVRERTVREATR